MRLINAQTLLFEEFFGPLPPPYAILSHRWQAEEVSYNEWRKATKTGHLPPSHPLRSKAGFQKVLRLCQIALQGGLGYVWVDTCCIDKTSSADLSESINSMFMWYKNAQVCYAYLCDWPALSGHWAVGRNGVPSSEWFTRGWTLQELIAPREVVFLDRDWNRCGTRGSMARDIAGVTGIAERCLPYTPESNPGNVNWWVTVWERMSWASGRKTTRVEDTAYSLLGLFGINMPLLYGEREQSFRRLQEEIVKVEEDCSILAWSALPTDRGIASCGLASSPDHFHYHNEFARSCISGQFEMSPLTMIQRGLQVPLLIRRDINDDSIGYAMIHRDTSKETCLIIPILFSKGVLYSFTVENECARISDPVSVPKSFMANAQRQHICFLREPFGLQPDIPLELRLKPRVSEEFRVHFAYPPQLWKMSQRFPMLLGKFDTRKQRPGSLIIELMNRSTGGRKVVIAQYQTFEGRFTGLVVRVAWCSIEMTLPLAEQLAHNLSGAQLEFCELVDRLGTPFHHTDILELASNDKFLSSGEDEIL